MKDHPGRDIQYFSWLDKKGVLAALAKASPPNEPVNLIGHSLGAAEAIAAARETSAKIDNLITIDPDGKAGDGTKPDNVLVWANGSTAPSDPTLSDLAPIAGDLVFGTTNTSGADISLTSDDNHESFSKMMEEMNAPHAIERSYQEGSKQCAARAGGGTC